MSRIGVSKTGVENAVLNGNDPALQFPGSINSSNSANQANLPQVISESEKQKLIAEYHSARAQEINNKSWYQRLAIPVLRILHQSPEIVRQQVAIIYGGYRELALGMYEGLKEGLGIKESYQKTIERSGNYLNDYREQCEQQRNINGIGSILGGAEFSKGNAISDLINLHPLTAYANPVMEVADAAYDEALLALSNDLAKRFGGDEQLTYLELKKLQRTDVNFVAGKYAFDVAKITGSLAINPQIAASNGFPSGLKVAGGTLKSNVLFSGVISTGEEFKRLSLPKTDKEFNLSESLANISANTLSNTANSMGMAKLMGGSRLLALTDDFNDFLGSAKDASLTLDTTNPLSVIGHLLVLGATTKDLLGDGPNDPKNQYLPISDLKDPSELEKERLESRLKRIYNDSSIVKYVSQNELQQIVKDKSKIDLELDLKGLHLRYPNGTYQIYILNTLSESERWAMFNHEIRHQFASLSDRQLSQSDKDLVRTLRNVEIRAQLQEEIARIKNQNEYKNLSSEEVSILKRQIYEQVKIEVSRNYPDDLLLVLHQSNVAASSVIKSEQELMVRVGFTFTVLTKVVDEVKILGQEDRFNKRVESQLAYFKIMISCFKVSDLPNLTSTEVLMGLLKGLNHIDYKVRGACKEIFNLRSENCEFSKIPEKERTKIVTDLFKELESDNWNEMEGYVDLLIVLDEIGFLKSVGRTEIEKVQRMLFGKLNRTDAKFVKFAARALTILLKQSNQPKIDPEEIRLTRNTAMSNLSEGVERVHAGSAVMRVLGEIGGLAEVDEIRLRYVANNLVQCLKVQMDDYHKAGIEGSLVLAENGLLDKVHKDTINFIINKQYQLLFHTTPEIGSKSAALLFEMKQHDLLDDVLPSIMDHSLWELRGCRNPTTLSRIVKLGMLGKVQPSTCALVIDNLIDLLSSSDMEIRNSTFNAIIALSQEMKLPEVLQTEIDSFFQHKVISKIIANSDNCLSVLPLLISNPKILSLVSIEKRNEFVTLMFDLLRSKKSEIVFMTLEVMCKLKESGLLLESEIAKAKKSLSKKLPQLVCNNYSLYIGCMENLLKSGLLDEEQDRREVTSKLVETLKKLDVPQSFDNYILSIRFLSMYRLINQKADQTNLCISDEESQNIFDNLDSFKDQSLRKQIFKLRLHYELSETPELYEFAVMLLDMFPIDSKITKSDYESVLIYLLKIRNAMSGKKLAVVNNDIQVSENKEIKNLNKLLGLLCNDLLNLSDTEERLERFESYRDSLNKYNDQILTKLGSKKVSEDLEVLVSIFGIVHKHFHYIVDNLIEISGSACEFKELLEAVPFNNAFTRIVRALGESSDLVGGHNEFICRLIAKHQWNNLMQLLVSLGSRYGKSSPEHILAAIEILESKEKQVSKWTSADWRKFTEEIVEYYEKVFGVLNPKLFSLYQERKKSQQAVAELREDLEREISEIGSGRFFGISEEFRRKYDFSIADLLVLFSKYLTINNLSSRDYCSIATSIQNALQKRGVEKWQAEVPERLRNLLYVEDQVVTKRYNGRLAVEELVVGDEKLDKLTNVTENSSLLIAYREYLTNKGEETKCRLKSEVLRIVAKAGKISLPPTNNNPEGRYPWLINWSTVLNDTFKEDAYSTLLKEVEECITQLTADERNAIEKDEYGGQERIGLESLKIAKVDHKIAKAILKAKGQKGINDLAAKFAKKYSLVRSVEIENENQFNTWVEGVTDAVCEKYQVRQELKDKKNLRKIIHQALLASRAKYLENNSLAIRIRQRLSSYFNEDRKYVSSEISSYQEVVSKGDKTLSVGFYDDMLHLMEFLLSGACTWVVRDKQIGRTKEHFGNLSLKNENGRVLAVSQVQLLEVCIHKAEKSKSKERWKTISLPGLYFDSSQSLISREKSLMYLLEYAQRQAKLLGMQGAVIPVKSAIHGQNDTDKAIISLFLGRGWLKLVRLESEVVLSKDPDYSYKEVYLVQIPESAFELRADEQIVKYQKIEVEGIEIHLDSRIPQVEKMQSEIKDIIESLPQEIKTDLKSKDFILEVEYDSSKEHGEIIEGRIVLGKREIKNSLELRELLAEKIASEYLLDYEELKRQSVNNENAYFKIAVVKALINHQAHLDLYHLALNPNPSAKNDWDKMSADARERKRAEYSGQLHKYTNGMRDVSQWNGFLNMLDAADPVFLVANYIYLLKKSGLKDEHVLGLIQKIAEVGIKDKVCLSRLRDVVKEVLLDGEAWLEIDSGMQSVKTYPNFSNQQELSSIQEQIKQAETEGEIDKALQELLKILFSNKKVVTKEMSRIVDDKIAESILRLKGVKRANILKKIVEEIIVRRLGKKALLATKKHLSATRGQENIELFSILEADLQTGDNADKHRGLLAREYQAEDNTDWYKLIFNFSIN